MIFLKDSYMNNKFKELTVVMIVLSSFIFEDYAEEVTLSSKMVLMK